jgi:hypothetical protein
MRRFRYALDPLCVVTCILYALNHWVLVSYLTGPFWRGHFDDLWFIPAALPPMLWVERRLGLRHHDRVPDPGEIGLHFVVWSVAAEVVAPAVYAHKVRDWWDIGAYAVGAVVAVGWWRWWPRRT